MKALFPRLAINSLVSGCALVVAAWLVLTLSTADAVAQHTRAVPGVTAVLLCDPNWTVIPSPQPGRYLYGVDSASVNDIWAVGNWVDGGVESTLIEHWDGTAWSIFPSPNPSNYENFLRSVTAVSPNDVWAVGSYAFGLTYRNLILHWNGTAWTVVPSPNQGSDENSLYKVTANGPDDVWAVGYYLGTFARRTLVLHWNGIDWSIVPSANGGNSVISNELYGVTALSPTNMWAIGRYHPGSRYETLIQRWDGTSWSIVPSPNQGISHNYLYDVAAASEDDIWAVGFYWNGSVYQTLTQHWGGTSWSIVPSPNQGSNDNQLYAVTAAAPNDVWAVGSYSDGSYTRSLIQHWDGSAWSIVPSPNVGTLDNSLYDVASVAPNDFWAVGQSGGTGALILRLNPCTATPTATSTQTAISVPSNTATSTPIPPRCPSERFTDVCPGDYFYEPVLYLNDRNIISGYNTAPPCTNSLHIPCFKPYSGSTRGQISKIVSLAAGFSEPVSGQSFEDVAPGSTFYEYIERMAARSVIQGYACGGVSEPCVPPANRPYFRPNNPVTRGQLSKMTSESFGFPEPVSGQIFEDVPPGSTFYQWVQRIASRGIIQGYACGSTGEPCVPPTNRPYFRPNNPVTRGQTSKIVQLAMTQPTSTPTTTLTPTHTPTPVVTATPTTEATQEPTSTATPTQALTSTATSTTIP